MRGSTRRSAAVIALLATVLPATVQVHAEEAAPVAGAAPKVQVSGLADWYYQYSFGNPATMGGNLFGRAFDVRHNSFSFSLGEANISRAVTKASPVGFAATLTAGKTADLVNLTEPGGSVNANLTNDTAYKYIQQLYGSWLIDASKGATLDFGKFVTMMGYEVIESSSNDNYSRGLLFTYAIPLYHAGLRLTYPLTPTLTGQIHVVNGWNSVEDDNGGKSVGVQLNYKPSDKLNLIANYMGGDEGGKSLGNGVYSGIYFPDSLTRSTHVLDVLGIVNATPKLKLALNGDYGGAFARGASGQWGGIALYARYQATTPAAVALRLEHFEDNAGLRWGQSAVANSITATYEYVVNGSLVNRLEYRHDGSNKAVFLNGSDGSRTQDTISFSQVYKF
jgi:hypothetical protein